MAKGETLPGRLSLIASTPLVFLTLPLPLHNLFSSCVSLTFLSVNVSLFVYPFESQKVAFLQPLAAHALVLSNLTRAIRFASLNFEP